MREVDPLQQGCRTSLRALEDAFLCYLSLSLKHSDPKPGGGGGGGHGHVVDQILGGRAHAPPPGSTDVGKCLWNIPFGVYGGGSAICY